MGLNAFEGLGKNIMLLLMILKSKLNLTYLVQIEFVQLFVGPTIVEIL